MARTRAGAPAQRPLAPPEHGPETVGSRLRAERERQRMSLRELARRLEVSASLISQVELGKASPSVGTLYAIVASERPGLKVLVGRFRGDELAALEAIRRIVVKISGATLAVVTVDNDLRPGGLACFEAHLGLRLTNLNSPRSFAAF